MVQLQRQRNMRTRYNGLVRWVAAATSIILPFLFFGPATSWVTNGLFPNGSGDFVAATFANCKEQPNEAAIGLPFANTVYVYESPPNAVETQIAQRSVIAASIREIQKVPPTSGNSRSLLANKVYAVAGDLFYFNIAIMVQLLVSCVAALASLCIVGRYAAGTLGIGRRQTAFIMVAIAIIAISGGAVFAYDETFPIAFPSFMPLFHIVQSIANFLGTADNSDNFTTILVGKVFDCANGRVIAPGIYRELLRLIDWGNFCNNSGAALIFICVGLIIATTQRITHSADGCREVIGNLEWLVLLAAGLLVSGMIALRAYLFLVADLAAGIGHDAFQPLSVAVVNNWGMIWSTTLFMAFLPSYLIWRSDVEVLAASATGKASYKRRVAWRRLNGLDIAYRDSIKTLLLIMGPALSGPILDLFRAITST